VRWELQRQSAQWTPSTCAAREWPQISHFLVSIALIQIKLRALIVAARPAGNTRVCKWWRKWRKKGLKAASTLPGVDYDFT
jgi:hypothetical protein